MGGGGWNVLVKRVLNERSLTLHRCNAGGRCERVGFEGSCTRVYIVSQYIVMNNQSTVEMNNNVNAYQWLQHTERHLPCHGLVSRVCRYRGKRSHYLRDTKLPDRYIDVTSMTISS